MEAMSNWNTGRLVCRDVQTDKSRSMVSKNVPYTSDKTRIDEHIFVDTDYFENFKRRMTNHMQVKVALAVVAKT